MLLKVHFLMHYIYGVSNTFKTKLKSLNVDAISIKEILTDLFGETSSELVQLGLADAIDSDDFAKKLSSLEEHWNDLEMRGKRVLPGQVIASEFYNWFVCEKSEVMPRSPSLQNPFDEILKFGNNTPKFHISK